MNNSNVPPRVTIQKQPSILLRVLGISVFLLSFMGCGIQGATVESKLQYPADLELDVLKTTDSEIVISFSCFNTEENFSGYNVYMLYGLNDEVSNLRNLINKHRGSYSDITEKRNPEEYILTQNHGLNTYYDGMEKILPTIPKNDVLDYYKTKYLPDNPNVIDGTLDSDDLKSLTDLSNRYLYPTGPFKYEFTIYGMPNESGGILSYPYTIGVTAYYADDYSPVESISSNIIKFVFPLE